MKQLELFSAIHQVVAKTISSDGMELDIPIPPPLSKAETHKKLLEKWGRICWGCNHEQFPGDEDLEVDHIRPKSDGGDDYLPNRSLLCSPCNKHKSNRYTLTYLRSSNKGKGRWNGGRPAISLKAAVEWAEREDLLRMLDLAREG